eukprot:TRINITY_DN87103_c0_g1_i1.p1 TRINITY_DN87103_c0_g1~~TRINITY_DN87103_c0_g1_i1.p1  ORF type:complete len:253 (+),score=38.84 TRINITY_DN87103_c0_g1_i1:87-845(+)
MAIDDEARYQAYDAVGRNLNKSTSLDTFELPPLSDTKSAVLPLRLSASVYGFGNSSRGMGYTAMSKRGLSRSGSSSSLVSPAGSSGSGCSSVSDPFRDLLRDLETSAGERGTDTEVSKAIDVEFTPSRAYQRELRRKANQARLDACDDLKRQVRQIKVAARQTHCFGVHGQPRPLKNELRRLKESIHKSQDGLLQDNVTELLAQKEIEFSPAFKAKLKRVASERDGLHPVKDLFGTSPGKHFLSRLRRYREN